MNIRTDGTNYICRPVTELPAYMQAKFIVPANTEVTAGEIFVANTLDTELGYGNWDVFEPDIVESVNDIPAIVINGGFEQMSDGRRPNGNPDYTQYIFRAGDTISAIKLLPETKFELSPDNLSNVADFRVALENGVTNSYLFPVVGSADLKWTANKADVNTKIYLVVEGVKYFRLGGLFGGDFALTLVVRAKANSNGAQGDQPAADPEITAINADVTEGLQVGNDNVAAGATVLTMQAVGGTEPYTYALTESGDLSADNASFVIADNKVNVGENALTEAKTYKIHVTVTDGKEKTFNEGFDIPVSAAE